VAIRGASGAGKSTIFHLLLRFLTPSQGGIAVDAEPLAELDMSAWLGRVSWLPQRPTLFHGTIRENIRLGRLSASDAEVAEAARLARVDGPLDTPVGELGQGLSGGQLQRVALARLFLREADLVLLDEPTAHLDAESERAVAEGIRSLAAGRTLIVVTHRAGWAEGVDRTLLVSGGSVVDAP
jgi:ATP-binding cassette subfamily C protein CydD